MRPRIGITTDIGERTIRGVATRHDEIQHYYVAAVWAAGGVPLLLPALADAALEMMSALHGVVLSGGDFDLEPRLYGDVPRPGLGRALPQRSQFELALVQALGDRPVLGVCGGMQLLNVARGGSLVQDLARQRPQAQPHQQPDDKREPAHEVSLSGSLRTLFARERLAVNSTHHQAVDGLGRELVVEALADDGTIEAIVDPQRKFFVGVQWHPEAMSDAAQLALYRALVTAAL